MVLQPRTEWTSSWWALHKIKRKCLLDCEPGKWITHIKIYELWKLKVHIINRDELLDCLLSNSLFWVPTLFTITNKLFYLDSKLKLIAVNNPCFKSQKHYTVTLNFVLHLHGSPVKKRGLIAHLWSFFLDLFSLLGSILIYYSLQKGQTLHFL